MQVRQAILTSWLNTFHHFKSVSKCHKVTQSSQTFLRSCRFCRQSQLSDTDCSRSPPKSSELNKQHRGQRVSSGVRKETGWRGRGGSRNVPNGAAAVKGLVPIGYDGAINLMAVQQNSPSRLTITYYQKKKSSLNSTQPLYPNVREPSINNKFELGPELGPSPL